MNYFFLLKKLISLLYDEDTIDIFDFDNTGGTLSNFVTLTGFTYDIGPYGLEFSSDSSKFYVSYLDLYKGNHVFTFIHFFYLGLGLVWREYLA
mgnify:CR=1 FL=1